MYGTIIAEPPHPFYDEMIKDNPSQDVLDDILANTSDIKDMLVGLIYKCGNSRNITNSKYAPPAEFPKFPNDTVDLTKTNLSNEEITKFVSEIEEHIFSITGALDLKANFTHIATLVSEIGDSGAYMRHHDTYGRHLLLKPYQTKLKVILPSNN